ncbi:Hypothetical predicted protein [Pelobates cultripes]|uniref:Uncharacterized protein n=1 Tax=Pelobates cultripes TaxID=61616 RepID=A0AAD1W207_PELCU|nr:Hypothetical predicted protein [Pelobates cultripes]
METHDHPADPMEAEPPANQLLQTTGYWVSGPTQPYHHQFEDVALLPYTALLISMYRLPVDSVANWTRCQLARCTTGKLTDPVTDKV